MSKWIRVDATRQQHPRSLVAGFWGGVVAEAVWEITKEHGSSGGVLPSLYWTSEYIARWTQADKERGGKVGIEKGMKFAVKAGLIEVLGNGDIQVHDWFECQRDGTDAERKKRQREAKKNNGLNPTCPGTVRDVSRTVPDVSRDVPKCHTDRTGQDNTKEKEGGFVLSPSDIQNSESDAPGWDPENGVVVFPSESVRAKLKANWTKDNLDFDAALPEFEKYHRERKTKIKSVGGRLAQWKKKAKPRIPVDPFVFRILKTYYSEWPRFHKDISKKKNNGDLKHANDIVSWIREQNWDQSEDELHEVYHDALLEWLDNPKEKGHPLAFFARSIDYYLSRVVSKA